MNKVKELHGQNDAMKEKGRFKAKLYGINSQLEGLAESSDERFPGTNF
jgi:hypothetical protein